MSQIAAAIFGCEGLRLTDEERAFFQQARPFGFILFSRNVEEKQQLTALCSELRECVSHHAPIFIDQEGGRVQRLRPPLARNWPAPLEQLTALDAADAERVMYLRCRLIAHELAAYGIDANCAPVLDLATPHTHAFLKNRCYGSDPDLVARYGRAMAQGLSDGGVLPVMKHIPGHGRAALDSHISLPKVSVGLDQLQDDFATFRALRDLPMAMTGHLVFEAIDTQPATTSAPVIELIRSQIGFQGLLLTDDISMQALGGSIAERSQAALRAGCDVVLHCNGRLAEMQALADVLPNLEGAAQMRAEHVLKARSPAEPVDISALSAELVSLGAADI